MSSCILGNVWDACAAHGIKGAKLMIMARLADYSNDDGVSYPGVETICRQLGLGESTVRTAITELESAGWLRREMRRKGNRNTSNRYYLNADRLENLARIEKDRVKRLRQLKNETRKFHPSDSEGSHFDPSDSERSGRFDPSDSGKKRVLTLQNLDPESQGLKPDPQVTSKQESQDTGTSADAIVPSSPGIPKYSPVFEEVWYAYPKRAGGNPKVSAWKAWSARLREGVKPEDILAGVKRYADYVRATGCAGTQFVKQAATFFGPDRYFDEDWEKPCAAHVVGSKEPGFYIAVSEPDKTIPDGFTGYLS